MRSLVLVLASVLLLAFLAAASRAEAPRRLRVLLVVDGTAVVRDEFQRMLALELDVARVTHDKLPAVVADYTGYDVVILSDVPAARLTASQVKALDTFTASGGAVIAAGGASAFGAKGGYQGTRLEQMLPVRFDAEAKPKARLGVVFVVDTTEAMKGKPLEQVLDGIKKYVAAMPPEDSVAIVAYDVAARVVLKPQAASGKATLDAALARLKGLGISTASVPDALKEAFAVARTISLPAKHVVLFSGETSKDTGIGPLVDDMRAARITVSTVGFFPKASRPLLTTISTKGDGRLHGFDDAAKLARFLADDLAVVVKSTPKGEHLSIAKKDPIIDGSGVDKAPPIASYAVVKAKPTADVLLTSAAGTPIFARWCHGGGNVAVWASDLDGLWSGDWPRWAGYGRFWTQLVRQVQARSCKKS